MADKKPTVLIIRDGWGVNPGGKRTAKKDGNASLLAKTPFHDQMFKTYPKGFIGLQVHGVGNRGPFDVAWKNLKIREL